MGDEADLSGVRRIAPAEFGVLKKADASSVQLVWQHNAPGARIAVTRVSLAPGGIQERHSHHGAEQTWIVESGQADRPVAKGRIVGRRGLYRVLDLRLIGRVRPLHGFQVLEHAGIHASLEQGGLAALHHCGEPVRERARAIVQVPVERRRDVDALRGREAGPSRPSATR